MALKYDMCVGRNKGHKVTKNISKARPGNRKGVSPLVRIIIPSPTIFPIEWIYMNKNLCKPKNTCKKLEINRACTLQNFSNNDLT